MDATNLPLDDSIRLLAPELKEYTDILRVALVIACRYTPLPELLDIFGPEYTVRFLDTFAGSMIEVPSKERIARAVRDTDVYVRIAQHNESINSVATLHNLDWHTAESIYRRMKDHVAEMEYVVPK